MGQEHDMSGESLHASLEEALRMVPADIDILYDC